MKSSISSEKCIENLLYPNSKSNLAQTSSHFPKDIRVLFDNLFPIIPVTETDDPYPLKGTGALLYYFF
jgi:hypothetical protein